MTNKETRLSIHNSESVVNPKERVIPWDKLGKEVRRIREEKHWSRDTLAEKAGCSKDTIRRLEKGEEIQGYQQCKIQGYHLCRILSELGMILLRPEPNVFEKKEP